MKVLKSGDGRKGWAKEKTCTGKGNGDGGCGAVLLVEQDDVFATYNYCMGESDCFQTIRCPECGCWTDFESSEVPFKPRERDRSRDGDISGDQVGE